MLCEAFPKSPAKQPSPFFCEWSASEHGWCSSCAEWRVCLQVLGYLGLRQTGSGCQTHYFYRIGWSLGKAVPKRRYSFLRGSSPCPVSPCVKRRRVLEKRTVFGVRPVWREAGKSPARLSEETPGRCRSASSASCPKECRPGTAIQARAAAKLGVPLAGRVPKWGPQHPGQWCGNDTWMYCTARILGNVFMWYRKKIV